MEEGALVSLVVRNTKPDCLPTVVRALKSDHGQNKQDVEN